MKFLVIGKLKDSAVMLPPAVTRQLLEMSVVGLAQQKKAGKVLDYYYSPVGYVIVILNYNTAEEWFKDQTAVPIITYMDSESYPLADGDASVKIMIESLKAAEKMMGGAPR